MAKQMNENDGLMRFPKPVLGFYALPGAGKSTLIIALLTLLKSQGLRIAVINQTQNYSDREQAEKGRLELTRAGAEQVLTVSDQTPAEVEFGNLVDRLDLQKIDLILVDGFGHLPFARIELYRPSQGNKLLFTEDASVIAVASDEYLETGGIPLLNINLPQEVAGYISRWLRNHPLTAKSTATV